MTFQPLSTLPLRLVVGLTVCATAHAAPSIRSADATRRAVRLRRATNPPIARFLPGQRFRPSGHRPSSTRERRSHFSFSVDGVETRPPRITRASSPRASRCRLTSNAAVMSGVPTRQVDRVSIRFFGPRRASDGQIATATQFRSGRAVRRGQTGEEHHHPARRRHGAPTAPRHASGPRVCQGKPQGRLAMDSFRSTGMVMTSSLDGIITDSSPGMSNT